MPSIMRERNSIPAHKRMASEFSRGSLEQPDLFSYCVICPTLVVISDGWSGWSRVTWAQGRRATRLRYAPTVAVQYRFYCTFALSSIGRVLTLHERCWIAADFSH